MGCIRGVYTCVQYDVAQASVPIELVHLVEDLDGSVHVLVHDLLLGRQVGPMEGGDPAGYPNGVRGFVEVHEINAFAALLLLLLLRGHFDAVCRYDEVDADISFAFTGKITAKQTLFGRTASESRKRRSSLSTLSNALSTHCLQQFRRWRQVAPVDVRG